MAKRGRPKKSRIVKFKPRISQFSPRGKPGRPDEAILSMDEFEAIRLAYFRGIHQKEAAKSMHISQQTFSRILAQANRTIAGVLIAGKRIKIEGGPYTLSHKQK